MSTHLSEDQFAWLLKDLSKFHVKWLEHHQDNYGLLGDLADINCVAQHICGLTVALGLSSCREALELVWYVAASDRVVMSVSALFLLQCNDTCVYDPHTHCLVLLWLAGLQACNVTCFCAPHTIALHIRDAVLCHLANKSCHLCWGRTRLELFAQYYRSRHLVSFRLLCI